jgi:predicted Zn-dependent peptidase
MRSDPCPSSGRALRGAVVGLLAACLLIAAASPAVAQNLTDFERKVTVHKLSNGWTFIIVERPVAPVFTFATYVDVGSAQEVPGITGIAHMFEHMAFKGTDTIGTNDFPKEKASIDRIETAYQALDAERRRKDADPAKVKDLEKAWNDAQDEAEKYVVKNQFDDIIDTQGGVGLNAGTSNDSTVYFYSLPSNKLELWAYLESDRFMKPVFREFYKERDVVKEERRMRTESQPFGRLFEQFVAAAFIAHPYGMPVVGYMSDLNSFSLTDAEAFYRKNYVPANITTAIVGDVKASEVIPLVEKYFGRIPKGDPPPPVRTVEPPQNGERVVKIKDPAQPIYLEGYHRPAVTDPDDEVYDAISTILGGGRTSRLYRSLVRDKQIAAVVQAIEAFPGEKYPNLFTIFAFPSKGHTTAEIGDAIHAELERLRNEEVSDAELAMVKARAKTDLIRSLSSNGGLAENLSQNQAITGDWKDLFRSVDRLDKVTKADIKRVASAIFVDTNRTVGMIETTGSAAAKPAPAGE